MNRHDPPDRAHATRSIYAQVAAHALLASAVATLACGPRRGAASWLERDTLGTSRAAGGAGAGSPSAGGPEPSAGEPGGAPVDLAALDARTIDELDEQTALAVLARLGERAPAARVALRVARLAWHRGDLAEARAVLARTATAADRAGLAGELATLSRAVADVPADPTTVAVLLPLSGRFAAIGGDLKLAIELAPAAGTRWLFLDTRGDPDGAVAAVEQARARGAIAILGPVGAREAVSAARAASLARIPIGLLAPADGGDPASGVFRLVGSPADEGRAVARLARSESFPTVGVFAPRDDVGNEAAAAFLAEARGLGLAATVQGDYDPTGGNLEADVKAFLNLDPATNPRLAAHLARNKQDGWKTFSPDVPFTLLYVPDRYDRAAIVAAFLPYFGVELRTREFHDVHALQRKHGGHIPQVVQLVGGAGWNHPSLPIRGGDAVQGALVVDTFGGALGGDVAAGFAQAFQQRSKRAPASAAAEAHDAALLMAQARAAAQGAPDPREALRAGLARGRLDDGACGPAAMDVDGELARTPIVLEVEGDQLIAAP